MTNLLLKTKTELFKWLQQQLCNGERDSERERERERETRAQTQAENSENIFCSIFLPLFQFKVHRTNCEQHSRLLHCSFNIFIYMK